MKILLIIGIILFLFGGYFNLLAEESGFQRHQLSLRYEMGEVFPIELTGDGYRELVVVEIDHSSREKLSHLSVFKQDEKGFQPIPAANSPLPAGLAMAGTGRFAAGGGLALLMPDRVEIWPWREGRFRPDEALVNRVESIFLKVGGELKAGLNWITDLDGDGFDELVIPRLDGFQVLKQTKEGSLITLAFLKTPTTSRLRIFLRHQYVIYELPVVKFTERKGVKGKNVVAFIDGILYIFPILGQPSSQPQPPVFEHDFQPPQPFDPQKPWDPPMRLALARDFNGDKLLDLAFTKNGATDSSFKTNTRVLIYYGKRKGGNGGESFSELGFSDLRYSKTPDQIFASEGFSYPIMLDINLDMRTDLVLVNVEIGFWNALKTLISRSISAEAAFYLMADNGKYPISPDKIEDFSVNFSLGRFTHQPITAFGDFNGDGLPDLLLSKNKKNLGLHWGEKEKFWKSGYDYLIEDYLPINRSGVKVGDLNGDGRDDLIFLYKRQDIRQMPQVNGQFTLLLSRFPFPARRVADSGY